LEAQMVIRSSRGERVVAAEQYFVGPGIDITRMTTLQPGELLTSIRIPATWAGAQFYFEKVRDRQVWDFPLVNVASAIKFSNGKVDAARIVVGAVAATPKRLANVEAAIVGKARDEATADMAGRMAVEGAVTLRYNGYKVPLMRNLVKRAIPGVPTAAGTPASTNRNVARALKNPRQTTVRREDAGINVTIKYVAIAAPAVSIAARPRSAIDSRRPASTTNSAITPASTSAAVAYAHPFRSSGQNHFVQREGAKKWSSADTAPSTTPNAANMISASVSVSRFNVSSTALSWNTTSAHRGSANAPSPIRRVMYMRVGRPR